MLLPSDKTNYQELSQFAKGNNEQLWNESLNSRIERES